MEWSVTKMKRLLSLFVLSALLLGAVCPAHGAEETGASLPLAASGMTLVGNTLYVADSYHRAVWTVENGEATLLAGRTDVTDLSGQPVEGYRDAAFDQAMFSEPWAIIPYGDGFLVSDTGNHVIRYLDMTARRVYTAVGTGEAGYRDGSNRLASFDSPTGLAMDDEGTVYIADMGNNAIRAMDQNGNVTTYAGSEEGCALGALSEARFSQPTGLCWADGVLYVADSGNHRVVAIKDGQVTLVAGTHLTGDDAYEGDFLNGPAESARFSNPQGVAIGGDGTVYIADSGNGAVRAVKDGYVTTLTAMDSGSTYPVSPRGLLPAGDTLYVGDVFSRMLFTCKSQAAEMDFTDVAKGTWYYDAVRFVWANDLFQGTSEGTFSPGSTTTRGMAVTALARLDGVDTTGSDPWYEAGRQWAIDNGISDGTAMDQVITREQLAVMLYRYAQRQGMGFTGAWAFPLDYADGEQISTYAYEAMCWMTMEGVITGVGTDTLAPRGSATRAQVAAMLQRLTDVLSAG